MGATAVTCVLSRIAVDDLDRIAPVFITAEDRVAVDLRRVRESVTPAGIARLAMLVREAQRRSNAIEVVGAARLARRALVDAGLQHFVAVSE